MWRRGAPHRARAARGARRAGCRGIPARISPSQRRPVVSSDLGPSLWRRMKNSWWTRGKKPGGIDVLTDGFLVTRGRRKTDIRWDDVVQIDGGVRDTLSLDFLFAVFRTPDKSVTIDEFDDGFRTFEAA